MPRLLHSQKSAELLTSLFSNDKPKNERSASVRHAKQQQVNAKANKSSTWDKWRLPQAKRKLTIRRHKAKTPTKPLKLHTSSSRLRLPELPFQRQISYHSASPASPASSASSDPKREHDYEEPASSFFCEGPVEGEAYDSIGRSSHEIGTQRKSLSDTSFRIYNDGEDEESGSSWRKSYIQTPLRRGSLRKAHVSRSRGNTGGAELPQRRAPVKDLFSPGIPLPTQPNQIKKRDIPVEARSFSQPTKCSPEKRIRVAPPPYSGPSSAGVLRQRLKNAAEHLPPVYQLSEDDVSSISGLGESFAPESVAEERQTPNKHLSYPSRGLLKVQVPSSSPDPSECESTGPEVEGTIDLPHPFTYEDFVQSEWRKIRQALRVSITDVPPTTSTRMRIPAGKVWRNQASNYFPPEAKGMSQKAVVRIIQGHQRQFGPRRQPETI